jgi:peptidyl-prolyl cis-trans isomerase B (cyclophilin B)
MKKERHPLFLITALCLWTFVLPAWSEGQEQEADGRQRVLLQTTEGDIVIALSDETPLHRDNFMRLVGEHFYDSLLFHRVVHLFMIQAGDPSSRHAEAGATLGEGELPYTLEPEFRVPRLYHRRGAVAMAREADEENPGRRSSSCQFYIVRGKRFSTKDLEAIEQRVDSMTGGQAHFTEQMRRDYRRLGGSPHLDGQYTVFGEVVDGMDVVERIQQADTDDYDRPVTDVRILKATLLGREGQVTGEGQSTEIGH